MNNSKKNIIYIGGFRLPDRNAAAQRVLATGKIFRDLGYNVIFIGLNNDLEKKTDINETYKKQFGFDTWEIPTPKSKKQWLSRILNPEGLEKVISNYAPESLFAVIPYNYPAIAQYRLGLVCKKHNAYYIPDITEWYESIGRGAITGIIKSLDTYLRMRVLNHKADALITTSIYLTTFYKNTVNNIIELPTLYDYKILEEVPANQSDSSDKTVSLLYAGNPFGPDINSQNRASVKDRLDKIITLVGNLKDIDYKLTIYGLTKERYLEVYPEHESLLTALNKKIFFYGRKPHQEIIAAIKQSHFTIFFRDVVRLTEAGFPSKLSESITAGTPVITNMISNLEPYLPHEKNIHIINLNDQTKQLNELLSLSINEIYTKKQQCLESKTFDYRSYIEEMNCFLQNIGDKQS